MSYSSALELITNCAADLASISGLLCLSTTWDEKFWSVNAAVRVLLTALRYGRSVLDYSLAHGQVIARQYSPW